MASSAKMMRNRVSVLFEKYEGWFRAHDTKIHNHSTRRILLIPIHYDIAGNPEETGTVDTTKARIIPAGDTLQVNSKKYDLSKTSSNFRIQILFRASDKDNFDEQLNDFHKGSEKERLFQWFNLHNYHLHLKCNEGEDIVEAGQVVSDEMLYIYKGSNKGKEEDGGTPTAEIQVKPELRKLIEGIQAKHEELKKEIEDLLAKMEDLVKD